MEGPEWVVAALSADAQKPWVPSSFPTHLSCSMAEGCSWCLLSLWKWEVFWVQPLKIVANSCLLYRLTPQYSWGLLALHTGHKPASLPWVTVHFPPCSFSLLSASPVGNSPQVARTFGMTLNSLIIILNDQTAMETHHHNCVCLLHWLFLVNLFFAFVAGWQMR